MKNVLIIGSGGREHAFAHQFRKSATCAELFILPGNAGTAELGINVPLDPLNFMAIGKFCLDNRIELVVVGPEDPLVKGIRNFFEADEKLKKIALVGPDESGARMEGSKDWSKAFMMRHNIPTAAYQTFDAENLQEGLQYISTHTLPVVLKADGLAAGKGVLICASREEAMAELNLMIANQKFGKASSRVVIEEYLNGIELSVFVLCDGSNYVILPSAKDYKRIGEGDTGLNTGGMGAISPVPFANDTFMKKVEERIIIPTVNGLKAEGINYKGFIFIGLMSVNEEPFVIEYNCRMGDPETEVVLPRIQNDLTELLMHAAKGTLDKTQIKIDSRTATTVMLVSKGYPEAYEKGKPMELPKDKGECLLFHAGTTRDEKGTLLSNGGRVMAITAFGDNIQTALQSSLKIANEVHFENKYFRRDIGFEFK